jgi:hypothetical protein
VDWKDVAGKISSAAPGVGALIGTLAAGPVVGTAIGGAAGKALQMVASLFGISSASVTPEQLDSAIASDPQAVLKLRMAEMDHERDMANIALEKEKLDHQDTRDALADVQNSRSRQIEHEKATGKSDINLYLLAWLFVGGFFTTLIIMMVLIFTGRFPSDISPAAVYLLGTMNGTLTAAVGAVVQYFFGKTKDSAIHTQMLSESIPLTQISQIKNMLGVRTESNGTDKK